MKDFSNAFDGVELPQQQSSGDNTPRESNVDWAAYNKKLEEVLGGVGKHQYIGVITNAYDLGTQEQDEQTIPVSDTKEYDKHTWRLETWENSGKQKDESAKIVEKYYKGQKQECLVYTPPPVKCFAMAVDFPEVMFPYGDFFEGQKEAPLRLIHGKEGFKTQAKQKLAGSMNFIAKPFKLNHTNVNRGKEGVDPHYALAKISKVYEIAEFTGVLDENENFHAQEIGKLIGKPVMTEVVVEEQHWEDKNTGEPRSKLVVDFSITAKLGPRDVPFYESDLKPKLTDDLFGFVVFNGDNEENTLKTINPVVINTMKMSPEFEGSKLAKQLESVSKTSSNQSGEDKTSKAGDSPAKEDKAPEKTGNASEKVDSFEEPEIDFDDSIPF